MNNSHENTHEHTNALIHETSPYLLQHAHNPVDWHPWNEETLKKAKDENKLMIISIGYAACHWCHVMEHESFEDSIVAKIMNENFLPVKVDREELPNVDDVYMTACQLTNQRGCGWPLNAFALPDGRPFWAGTYFPKDQWMNILNQFTTMKSENYAKLEDSAERITQGISQAEDLSHLMPESEFTLDTLTAISNRFIMEMDMENGGRRGAPKFPMPSNIEYLLEYYHLTKDQNAYRAAITTLDKMALGGIYDQLGGGFSRYSVDGIWLAPHFEKMTYDNSQLVSSYAHGYQLTKNPLYKRIIEETLAYTEREMTSPENAFYASLDADSEGEEGKFYVWSKSEVDSLFTDKKEAEIFCYHYDITEGGNWEHTNIMRMQSDKNALEKFKITEEALNTIIDKGKKLLFEARSKRIRPGLDDKILTSWNALMLKGYLDAYGALGNQDYLEKAKANAAFIEKNMLNKDFRLDRNYKHGKANINAFLDDYAAVIQAFISMYEHTFNESWLEKAKNITDYTIAHFYDEESNLFFYTSDIDAALVARKKEIADNVIPSSNSMMAHNLHALGTLYDNKDFLSKAEKMIAIVANQVGRISQPSFYSNWLRLYKKYVSPPYEVAFMGSDAAILRNELMTNYRPDILYMGSDKESQLPLLQEKFNPDRSLIYVCQNKVCKFPVDNVAAALEQLK